MPGYGILFFFVIKQAVAVAFEIFVGDLLAEFLADTFGILARFHTAGAIAAATFQAFFDDSYDFFIFIEANFHSDTTFFVITFLFYSKVKEKARLYSASFAYILCKFVVFDGGRADEKRNNGFSLF